MALLALVSTQKLFADSISTNSLYVSSITGVSLGTTTSELTSTIAGLGSAGYISSSQLVSTVAGIGTGGGGLTTTNLTSTVDGLGSAGYISSSQLVSTVAGIGTGGGGLASIPSTLSTFAVLTSSVRTSTLLTNTLSIGNLSSINSLQFYGLQGNYNNTVLAEISTGAGTQELLVFKGSSTSDRVRFQTTGNFVVETGVSARLWSNTTIPTQSNVTPAFIINSSSNVGIQTATPGATLDVAGTARAITLSSQALFVSTLNSGNPLVNAVTTNSMVALTYNSNAFTYDGNQWIRGSGIGNQVHGLAFNDSLWVSGTEAGIYSSADGINWGATSFTGTPTSGVAWNGSLWVVGGWYGGMWFSYDGYTWTACPQAPSQAIQDIAWGNDKFIAACAGAVYYSYDGLYWYNLGNILAGSDQTYCVAYNGRQWLIGGRNASVNNIAYSYDGLRWFNTSVTFQINDLAWSGRIWVAVTGTNQTVLSSPDGITWTSRTNTNYTDLGGGYVAWNGSFFYAASGNSFIYLSRSTDGITWTSLGTIAGQQIRKIKARYVLPLNGAQEPAGIYAQNIFLGISTNQTVLRFPGGDGLYRNTVIGEISSTQTRFAQELIMFKGSTMNDRIRFQTTGEIRFEAGVPSRFFSSISSIAPIATPTFLISTNSNIGIGTALPAATLDVVGTGRFQTVSTLALNISTINGQVYTSGGGGSAVPYLSAFTVSTGSAEISSLTTSTLLNTGFLSTYSLTVYGPSTLTVQGLAYFQNVVSSYSLITGNVGILDTVTGQPVYIRATNGSININGVSTVNETNLASSIEGLGSAGYISSSQLVSTVGGLGQIYISTAINQGNLTSSIEGLGSAGYISSSQLVSTVDGLGQIYISTAGGGLSVTNLTSTVGGLGQIYISTAGGGLSITNLTSTVGGLATAGYLSSVSGATGFVSSLTLNALTVGSGAARFQIASTQQLNVSSISFVSISSMAQVNIPQGRSNVWVAVGTPQNTLNPISSLAYSYNGMNYFTANSSGFTGGANAVAWNGFMWVAVGNDTNATSNTIQYSYDGVNWNRIISGGFATAGGGAYDVAWNGNLWVAVGQDPTLSNNTIKYSGDGLNWSNAASGGFPGLQGRGVAWNGSMWVATGLETGVTSIKYSYNGRNWSNSAGIGFLANGRGVAWNGQQWLALGSNAAGNTNSILNSYDGITWTGTTTTAFSGASLRAAWNGRMWVAVGNNNTASSTIKYSYDGVNWSNVLNSYASEGAGIAWNGNMWVAVGNQGNLAASTIKYSYDGITWLTVGNNNGVSFQYGNSIGFSSNLTPSYTQSNFEIEPQNIPVFIRQRNQMSFTQSSIILNNTLFTTVGNKVGINTGFPQTDLDVGGTGRFIILSSQQLLVSSIFANQSIQNSSFTSSLIVTGNATITSSFITSLRVNGNAIMSSTFTSSLFVTGNATMTSSFISSLRVNGPAIMSSTFTSSLRVNGPAIMSSTFTSSLFVTGPAIMTSTLTSSLLVNGSALIKWNGTTSGSLYGSGIDTFTLQSLSNAYVGGIASMAFATNTAAYPLARMYALDSATSGSPLSQLVFQTVAVSATSFSSNFSYTGSDQTFTVPAGVTIMQVTLWGAGGAGGYNGGGGGAGAFVQGRVIVSAGQVYRIIVGQGGVMNSASSTYGGGGGSGGGNPGGSSGGGRSALMLVVTATISSSSGSGSAVTYTTNVAHGLALNQPVTISGLSPSGFNGNFVVSSTPTGTQFVVTSTQTGSSTGTGAILAEVVDAGGGGCGGYNGGLGGAATFSGTAFAAPNNGSFTGGGGGTQTGGGAGGAGAAYNGSALQGGPGLSLAGGGGGGYYGGGGGLWSPGGAAGGGGGSSYTSLSVFSITSGLNSPNSANQAPGQSVSGYISGVAAGGTSFQTGITGNGGNGLIIINSVGGSMTEAMRVGSNGFVGIATTTPAYTLDVAGNTRVQNLLVGTTSTVNTIAFNGLFNNYNNTVLSEISTGGGFQELLLFKGSSVSDRVRIQTTGAFVVETGVSARLWNPNTFSTLSNATPALIINSSSNVGIQTATPATTLDVAGTGRFQTTSTLALRISSINGDLYKSFVIDHPIDNEKYLVHACLEGPEVGVYYRGEGRIIKEKVSIFLPDYVNVFATDYTVQVTSIFESDEDMPRTLMVSRVHNGSFTVKGPSGSFYWHVYGKRANIEVEPRKADVSVLGQGPYKWILG